MKYNKYILLLILILIVIFWFNTFEGFQTTDLPQPKVINSPLRIDRSCSDPDQTNSIDRYDGMIISNPEKPVKPIPLERTGGDSTCKKEVIGTEEDYEHVEYNGISNLCLPFCPAGFEQSAVDNTMCIANYCSNSIFLSSDIKNSWDTLCAALYKEEYTLTNTVSNISNVSYTMNNQFRTIQSNYIDLSNKLYSYDCTQDEISARRCLMRDYRLSNIQNSYLSLNNLVTDVNINYNSLKQKKNAYDTVYTSLLCDRY